MAFREGLLDALFPIAEGKREVGKEEKRGEEIERKKEEGREEKGRGGRQDRVEGRRRRGGREEKGDEKRDLSHPPIICVIYS